VYITSNLGIIRS
jgi:hypothetical protein